MQPGIEPRDGRLSVLAKGSGCSNTQRKVACMRRVSSLGACVVLAALFLSPGPLLAQPPQVVVGADDPQVDVPAVQAAVDRGGKILLRGTFDFGTDAGNHIIVPGRAYPAQDLKGRSTIFIAQHDVTIMGETGSHGELLTVVKNGMPPFWVGWDGEVFRTAPVGTDDVGTETFPQDTDGRVAYRDGAVDEGYLGPQTRFARGYPNVSATIKHICFDSPGHYGVKATAGRDVVVIGNIFRNVQFGGLVNLSGFYGPGTSAGATKLAVAAGGVSLFYPPFLAPAISGELRIEQNLADDVGTQGTPTHFGETFGFLALMTSARVNIQANRVRNVGRQTDGSFADVILAGGILVGDNYAAAPLIAGNVIENSLLYGIWDAAFVSPAPAARIERNSVTDSGFIGIAVESYIGPREGGLVYGNFLAQDARQWPGVSLIGALALDGCTIGSNTLAGDVPLVGVALQGATGCAVVANKDKRETVSLASPTYFLDQWSSGNLVKAATGTVVDYGTNNTVLIAKQ